MKIKLLISAALFMGLSAAAQSVSAPAITFNAENADKPVAVPMTLTMPDGGDFTNIQVMLEFPEGLLPACVDYDDDENLILSDEGFYTEVGEDVATYKEGKNRYPAVSYSDNFADEDGNYNADRWPNFTIVGANMKKIATTTNPAHFLTFFVKYDAPAEAPAGMFRAPANGAIKTYVKYTQFDDQSFTVGAEDNMVELTTVTYDFAEEVAVEDVNAAKAVSSVKYYNAAGVAADNAFEGVNIVVTKYVDGSQSVVKVVK